MKKIESLTQEQTDLLKVYRDKWMSIGLSTTPGNHLKAEEAIRRAYNIGGHEPPKQIVWAQSPLSGWLVVCILKEISKKKDMHWASVSASVRTRVWASVMDSVRDSVMDSVMDSVRASVRASVGDSVKNFSYYETGFGQHDANWLGFYNYFLEVLKLKSCEKLIPLMDLSEHANWFYPYQDICVVSEKPIICELKAGRIHSETGPSVGYRDGFNVYGLNGIRVPEWVVMTPISEIKKEMIVGEKNADVRRELIRRIGFEKLTEILEYTVMDRMDEYELISFDIGDGRVRPYLKMTCPSTKLLHIEGVLPEIQTVKKALAYKFKVKEWKRPLAEA